MNEIYAEVAVKRVNTVKVYAIKFILAVLVLISVLLAFISIITLIIGVIFIAIAIYLFPKLNVEYEYIYCDGQLDFDKIMGNARRKTVLRIDFEQVEIMAPADSHSLDGYNNVKITKDYSSGRKDAKPYAIIARKDQDKIRILFEPNANMINCIKLKNQRKVIEY